MANAREIEKGVWRLDSCYKRQRKTFRGTSSKDVKKQERDWMREIDDFGKKLNKSKCNFIELARQNLFLNIKDDVSEGTFERYMCAFRKHISVYKEFDKDVKEITQDDIKRFFNSKKDMSKTSIKMMKIVIKSTFDYAVSSNFVRDNICKDIKLPKSNFNSNRTIEAFTLEEQNSYLNYVKNTLYNEILTTAFATGMRQGELVALRWENVDLTNNIIHVKESSRRVMIYGEDETYTYETIQGNTKTVKSNRDIPISKEISSMLKKLKLKNGGKDKDFVFLSAKSEQIKNDTLKTMHKRYCKFAGVKEINFHCIRHTFATRMIEQGVDVKTLSELMGHSDVSITLNRYVHTSNESKRYAIEKISKLISTL